MNEDAITLIQGAVAVMTGGVLGWVVRALIERNGALAPRWYAEQEHEGRLAAERRTDRVLDLFDELRAAGKDRVAS